MTLHFYTFSALCYAISLAFFRKVLVFLFCVNCYQCITHCGHVYVYMCASSSGFDMSTFIRRYGRYLNEKSFAYRQMSFDFVRVKKG